MQQNGVISVLLWWFGSVIVRASDS